MRRLRLLAIVIAALLLAGGTVSSAAREAGAAPSVSAKKKCKLVKKRVHGKIRKVRVCTKPKPAPSLPSKVSVTLDSAHAATASISAESGATLTAGAATLTVPAGAVAQTTTVTMTPVSKLGGLKGRIAGAVQFEPDGLQLLKPVTLTIDVTSTSGLEAFTYAGNGTDFHLYPVKIEGGKATVDLIHFSGYGVGEGLPSPSVAKVRQFLTTVVKPAVEQATRDSRYFAFAAFRTWELVFEMVALSTDDFVKLYEDLQAVEADLGAALRKFADDQHSKCVETHDIVRTGKETEYTLWLVLPLLVLRSQPLADSVSYARQQVAKCERFELDFDSQITYSDGDATSRVRVQGLKLNPGNEWTNEKALDYWSWQPGPEWTGLGCTWTTRTDGPFKAKLDKLDPGPRAWYLGGVPPRISMNVFVGTAQEIRLSCSGIPLNDVWTFWEDGIFEVHGRLLSWTIGDWKYIGQSVFAERTYTGSGFIGCCIVTEKTTFTLRHTPE